MQRRAENMFRALFTPYRDSPRPEISGSPYRRRLKWDWHLRNLIYALTPGALVFVANHFYEKRGRTARLAVEVQSEPAATETPEEDGKETSARLQSEVAELQAQLRELREALIERRPQTDGARATAVADKQQSTADAQNAQRAPRHEPSKSE